jgi:hypothetical protein
MAQWVPCPMCSGGAAIGPGCQFCQGKGVVWDERLKAMWATGCVILVALVLACGGVAYWFKIGWWAEAQPAPGAAEQPTPAEVAADGAASAWIVLALVTYPVFSFGVGAGAGVGLETVRRLGSGLPCNRIWISPPWIMVLLLFFGLPVYLIGSYLGNHNYQTAALIEGIIGGGLGLLIGIVAEKHLRR